jgi:collagenase-like PrtC family protease
VKLSVGYWLPEEGGERCADVVHDYTDQVGEVYFAWPGQSSGRAAVGVRRGYVDWRVQAEVEQELAELRRLGVRLNLLFNANCYGGRALSEHLEHEVTSIMDHLGEVCGGVESVTTTSLAIANTLKRHDPAIKVRASVNMRIGTIPAMEYVAHLFDEYCVQREHNRDPAHLRELRAWADAHGKTLSLLVNSGCLAHCSGQTFHDNLVAHEREIDEARNVGGWSPVLCQHVMRDPANHSHLLRATWIRPEDIHHLDGLIDGVKLATRLHDRPRMVIAAYAKRQYPGNLLNLLEPSHAAALDGVWIDNAVFPDDWWERTSACGRRCGECEYCQEVWVRVRREGDNTDRVTLMGATDTKSAGCGREAG